jgi:predicted ester cyclase
MNTPHENKALIDRMYAAMNENRVGVMEQYWTKDMVWAGPAGIGTKRGVAQFENEVRDEFIRAFPDKVGVDRVRIAEGDWVAGAGWQDATHAADWLGIRATGKPVAVRYMDFWRIEQGEDGQSRIAENWVMIDILGVLEQAGYNVRRVLEFVGSLPPSFFEDAAAQEAARAAAGVQRTSD